jgi:hypothetical protein
MEITEPNPSRSMKLEPNQGALLPKALRENFHWLELIAVVTPPSLEHG